MTRETVPLGPTRYLLHKVNLSRQRDVAGLPNNRKKHREETNEETEKHPKGKNRAKLQKKN